MGGFCSRAKPFRILIMGLDCAGKTTLLYQLKLGEVVTTIPTIGINIETVTAGSVEMVCWDVGGRDKMRALYRHYYQGTNGFVYIIDCTDRERLDEALYELCKYVLEEEETRDSVMMVLANKQDVEKAIGVKEVEEKIQEKCTIKDGRSMFVMPCSAVTREGLSEAFQVFAQQMKRKQAGGLVEGFQSHAIAASALDDKQKDVAQAKLSFLHNFKTYLQGDPFHFVKSILFY